MKKRIDKKAVSPVIASVLLIGIVVVMSVIIFLWFRGFTQESVTKFDKNIALVCEEVDFQATYSGGKISVSNTGNVPLYDLKVKISSGGNFETKDLSAVDSSWPDSGLVQGRAFSSSDVSGSLGSPNSLTFTPVLIGSEQKTHVCEERFGKEIIL